MRLHRRSKSPATTESDEFNDEFYGSEGYNDDDLDPDGYNMGDIVDINSIDDVY